MILILVALNGGLGLVASLKRKSFRPRPLSSRMTRNKRLQNKQVYKERNWDTWTGPVTNVPTPRITPYVAKHAINLDFVPFMYQVLELTHAMSMLKYLTVWP